MAALQAVLFDLDDTLYPERDYVRSGFRAAAARVEGMLGIPRDTVFEELWGYFQAGVRGNTYNTWLESHGLEAERWVPELVTEYRKHLPDIQLHQGVDELLEELAAIYRLGLITEGHTVSQQNKLKALGLEAVFEVVVITDMEDRAFWKPHTRPYTNALEQLGILPERSVYVGDNPRKDFFGARQLGMHTVRVQWPGGLNTDLQPETPAHGADVSMPDLGTLPDILASFEEEK
jgi:putative hydrolase of the HAD superfamily